MHEKRKHAFHVTVSVLSGNVDMKPGKSTTLGSCEIDNKTKYFLCLSGNPVSAFIAAQIFLLHFVKKMCCYANSELILIPVRVSFSYIAKKKDISSNVFIKL